MNWHFQSQGKDKYSGIWYEKIQCSSKIKTKVVSRVSSS